MGFSDYLKPLESYHPDLPANMGFDGNSYIKSVDITNDAAIIIEHFIGKYRAVERLPPKYYTGMNSEHLKRVFARIIADNGGKFDVADQMHKEKPNVAEFICLIANIEDMLNSGHEVKVPIHIQPDGRFRKFVYYPKGADNE